jgi:hypothetical protein
MKIKQFSDEKLLAKLDEVWVEIDRRHLQGSEKRKSLFAEKFIGWCERHDLAIVLPEVPIAFAAAKFNSSADRLVLEHVLPDLSAKYADALRKLSRTRNADRDNRIVAMRDEQGLSFSRIARELQMTRVAAERAYHRKKRP